MTQQQRFNIKILLAAAFMVCALFMLPGVRGLKAYAETSTGNGLARIVQVDLLDGDTPISQAESAQKVLSADTSIVDIAGAVVEFAGVRHVLVPKGVSAVAANVRIPNDAVGISVVDNVFSISPLEPDFIESIGRVNTTSDLRNFVSFDDVVPESLASYGFDLVYSSPLDQNDFLVMAERNGDQAFRLEALSESGEVINASGFDVDSNYSWNTGIASSYQTEEPQWLSIVPVSSLGVGSEKVHGLRVINTDEADIKLFAMSVSSSEEIAQIPALGDTAEDVKADSSEEEFIGQLTVDKTAYVGHNDGEGCQGADDLTTTAGAAITYCFMVANTGTQIIAGVTVDDGMLAVDGLVTTGRDASTIFPGEAVEYYFQTEAPAASTVNEVSIAGQVVDLDGNPIAGVANPFHTDTLNIAIVEPSSLESQETASETEDIQVDATSLRPDQIDLGFDKTINNERTDDSGDKFDLGFGDDRTLDFDEAQVEATTDSYFNDPDIVTISAAELNAQNAPDQLAFTGTNTSVIFLVLALGLLFFGCVMLLAARKELAVNN